MTEQSDRLMKRVSTIVIVVFATLIAADYAIEVANHRTYFGVLPFFSMLAWPIACVGTTILIWEKSPSVKNLGAGLVIANPVISALVYSIGKVHVLMQRSFWFGVIAAIAIIYLFYSDHWKKN